MRLLLRPNLRSLSTFGLGLLSVTEISSPINSYSFNRENANSTKAATHSIREPESSHDPLLHKIILLNLESSQETL